MSWLLLLAAAGLVLCCSLLAEWTTVFRSEAIWVQGRNGRIGVAQLRSLNHR